MSLQDLTNKIEELTASSARLNAGIKNLEKEVAQNQEVLDSATAIREKELAKFNAEEKDSHQAISALGSAVTVLGKHHGSSFLQMSSATMSGVATSIQHQLSENSDMWKGVLTYRDRRALAAFIQTPEDYFDAEPTLEQSYAPQSGEILGI